MNVIFDNRDVPVLKPREIRLSTIEGVKIMNCVDNTLKNISLTMALSVFRLNSEFMSNLRDDVVVDLQKYLDSEQDFEFISSTLDSLLNIRQNRFEEEEDFRKITRLNSDDFWTRSKSLEVKDEDIVDDTLPVTRISMTGLKYFTFSPLAVENARIRQPEIAKKHKKVKNSIAHQIRKIVRHFHGAKYSYDREQVIKLRKGLPGQRPFTYTNLPTSPRDQSDFYHPKAIELLPGEADFATFLSKLRQSYFIHLLTGPEEVEKQKIKLEELKDKADVHQQLIDKLTSELRSVEDTRDKEIEEYNFNICSLQNEIDAIKQYSIETIKRLERENLKEITSERQNSEARAGKLIIQLNEIKRSLEETRNNNLLEEADLRTVKFKKESEIETFISKFDVEMLAMKDEYDQIDNEYTIEKQELYELEEKFKTLSEEYEVIMEKRRVEAERIRKEEEERQALINAATIIQAFWRSFKTRKVYRGKKKRGRKG